MMDPVRSKQKLIDENSSLKRRIQELETAEAGHCMVRQELIILAEIGQVIGSTLDINEVYEQFAAITQKLIPFDAISINLIDQSKSMFRIAYYSGPPLPERTAGLDIPLPGTMTESVLKSKSPMLFQVTHMDEMAHLYPGITRFQSVQSGFFSNMLIPLVSHDAVSGVLHFRAKKKNAYSDAEAALAVKIGMQIAGAIANAQLYKALKEMEKQLLESGQRYRLLVENADEAIVVIQDGMAKFVNHGATWSGYSEEEYKSRPALEFIHPDDRNIVTQRYLQKIKGDPEPTRHRYRAIHKNGQVRWIEAGSVLIKWEGQPATLNLIKDITDIKQAEALMAARMRLMSYAQTHSLAELLQATLDEVETLTESQVGFYHFVDPDQVTLSLQAWSSNTVQADCKAGMERLHYPVDQAGVWVDSFYKRTPVIHNDYASLPHRKGLPDGHVPVIRELVVPVLRDGLILALLGVGNKSTDYNSQDGEIAVSLADLAWDIAERKQAEETKQNAAKEWATSFDAMPDGVSIHAMDHTISKVNQTLCELLGKSEKDLIGKKCYEIFHGTDTPIALCPIELTRRTWKKESAEFFEPGLDKWLSVSSSPVFDAAGRLTRLVHIVRDVTDRKRIEEEKMVLAEIGRVIGSTLDIEEVYERFVLEVRKLLDFDRLIVNINQPEEESLAIAYVYGSAVPGRQKGDIVPLAGSLNEALIRNRKGLILQPASLAEIAELYPNLIPTFQAGMRSMMSIPLIARDQVIGCLHFRSKTPDRYNEDMLRLAERIGMQIAAAIDNAQLFDSMRRTEKALRDSKNTLAAMINASPESAFLIDPEGLVINCNSISSQRLGLRPEEMIGRNIYELIPQDVAATRKLHVDQAVHSGEPLQFEDVRGGRHFHHSVRPVRDSEGRVSQVAIFGQDVTEYRSNEETLKKQRDLLASIGQAQDLFISGHDPRQVYEEMLHILVAATGSSFGFFDEVLHDPDGTPYKLSLAISDISWDEKSIRLHEMLTQQKLEFRNLDNLAGAPVLEGQVVIANDVPQHPRYRGIPNGHPPLTCYMGIPLYWGGDIIGVAAVANRPGGYSEEMAEFVKPLTQACTAMIWASRIVKREKMNLLALQASEEKYRQFVETANEGIWAMDGNHYTTYVNRRMADMLGYLPAEMIGIRLESFMFPEELVDHATQMEARHNGKSSIYERRFRHREGSEVWTIVSATPEHNEQGAFVGSFAMFTDITERKRGEQENVILANIGRMIGSTLNIDEIYERLAAEVQKLIPYDSLIINQSNLQRGTMDVVYTAGLDIPGRRVGDSLPMKGSFGEEAIFRRRGMILHLDNSEDYLARFPGLMVSLQAGLRSLMSIPLISRDEVVGTLVLRAVQTDAFTEKNLHLAERIGMQVAGAIANARLFGELSLAERSLRESEENNRALFEDGPIESLVVDQEGRIIKYNKAFELSVAKRGRRLPEIGSMMYVDYASSHSIDMRFELMDSITSKKAKTFNEMPYSEQFLNISIAPTREGAIISTIDVTERVQAIEKLREMSGRLSLATSAAKAGVWDWNIDTNEMIWDDRMLELYGYSKETFPGGLDSWVKGLHPDDAPRVFQEYQAALRGDLDFNTEFRIRHAGGKVIHIKANGLVLRDDKGKPLRMIGLNTDITNQKKMQEEREKLEERLQQAEKMEALGQLAGGVAHDLNNVLGVTSIFSELLKENLPEGGPLWKSAESIYTSTRKAASIIEDLLTLARRGVMQHEVTGLNSIVSGFASGPEMGRIKGDHTQVRFNIEYDHTMLNIKGSSVHLEKTVMNLVSNAAEAITGSGEVTIRTESRYLDRPVKGYDEVREGEYGVLMVSDTGMGIPQEHMGKIFEPFYTKKRMGKSGTGLGLAIVWGTVKDHQGYIDVQSEEGRGTTFTLYFPATREEVAAEQEKTSIDQYMGQGESILVVDDVAEQRQVAEAMLRRLGYGVHTLGSGEEAVEYLRTHKADLMVLDMIMDPGMDGLETYRIIREENPHQRAIIVSGFSETKRVREAHRLGAGEYVKKPYQMEKIGMAIREELDRK